MGFYEDKIFPVLCTLAGRIFDEQRQEVFAQAYGRVLEIGVGTGSNFEFYPESATEVVGIEKSPAMLAKAEDHLREVQQNASLPTKIALKQGDVTTLDFPDSTFDTVVTFLVLCSVAEPEKGAKEMYRVLKPGGQLLFFEHVLAETETLSKWQHRLNPLWKRLACGCNLTRETKGLFEKAGFEFEEIAAYRHPDSLIITSPKIQGRAVKA